MGRLSLTQSDWAQDSVYNFIHHIKLLCDPRTMAPVSCGFYGVANGLVRVVEYILHKIRCFEYDKTTQCLNDFVQKSAFFYPYISSPNPDQRINSKLEGVIKIFCVPQKSGLFCV